MAELATPPLINRSLRQWVVVGLLVFGVQLSLIASANFWFTTALQEYLLGVVLVLTLIPFTRRPIAAGIERLRHLGPSARGFVAVLVFVGAAALLLDSVWIQNRDLALKYHDEFSYALQARMLASGRLWMPHHPLADFFDSFQVIVDPVYCSMYFPGAALLLVPAIWLHVPLWLMTLLIYAGCVAMTYYLVARLVDDVSGILAALMVVESSLLHSMSILVLAEAPLLFYSLCATAAWLCWRDAMRAGPRRRWRARVWAILVGAFCGLAAITRPLDAVLFALPIGVAIAGAIWYGSPRFGRALAPVVGWIVLGAAPFLGFQAYFDHGVTGSYFTTPFDFYAARDYPQTSIGFHTFDPTLYPKSVVPEKHARPAQHTWKFVREHTPIHALGVWWKRLPLIASETTADPFILVLLPLGFFSLCRRQWVMAAVPVLFPFLYYFYTFYFPHYIVPLIPAMALVCVVGAAVIPVIYPRIGSFSVVVLTLGIIVICVTDLPGVHRARFDMGFQAPHLREIDETLAALPPERAVVLFKFVEGGNTEEEPVHNETVCWPDDARIIRAQDLGDRDIELFHYYAKIQPDRVAYRYDRGTQTMTRLGRVGDLAGGTATSRAGAP